MIKADKKNNREYEEAIPKKITAEALSMEDRQPSGLKELIEKNIKWSQVIYEQNKKIKRRLTLMVFGNYLRLIIILTPIIFGIIYLPPLIQKLFENYGGVFESVGGKQGLPLDQMGGMIQMLLGGNAEGALKQITPEQLEMIRSIGR